jgi:hypothetical protein
VVTIGQTNLAVKHKEQEKSNYLLWLAGHTSTILAALLLLAAWLLNLPLAVLLWSVGHLCYPFKSRV